MEHDLVNADWPLYCSLLSTILSVKAKINLLKDKHTTMQILDVCKGPIVPQWQKAAHWTSAIHSHAVKAQSYNTD